MTKRLDTRAAMLRLARMRELIATQRLAGEIIVRNEAEATETSEQETYATLSQHYARATERGGPIDLSRYEMLDALRRAGETRLAQAAQRVDESSAAVARAGTLVNEASERTTAHRDRLDRLTTEMRDDVAKREQHEAVETWMRGRSAP